ncbi:hypothetical protein AOZ06_18830 [Kibdelosporangium phytohabitans]|uniref:Uncharacterized protein n=2 Tax=Kibdelosporangium phytohabitans TaxID=860235 RepID=A0A0N9IHN0_9PSEU|nr:hypothetical protein AOZ06_18830 [Kibdelosporangium phytohabitans]
MSTGSVAARLGTALAKIWRGGRKVERRAYVVGAVLFASGLVAAAVLLVTGGSWTGPVSLRKAATFGMSFGLTLATVAWAVSYLKITERSRTFLLTVFTVVSVVETGLVSMQAWRGVPSHFNFETPFDSVVSMSLAAGGGVIILSILGLASATIAGTRDLSAAMRIAVRAGFVILLIALAVGAVMIARGVVEARSGQAQLAYTTAGELKPAHAVAMHAILVLPGLAWLVDLTGWADRVKTRVVLVGTGGYALLTAVVLVESIRGVSPFAASAPEMAVSVLAVALVVGAALGAAAGLVPPGQRGSDS